MPPKSKVLPVATLDQIRKAKDLAEGVDVPVEEWGCTVVVRGLSRGEIKGLHTEASEADDPAGRYDILALALGCVEPKLTEEEAEELLGAKGLRPVKKVLDAILEASGLSDGFR